MGKFCCGSGGLGPRWQESMAKVANPMIKNVLIFIMFIPFVVQRYIKMR